MYKQEGNNPNCFFCVWCFWLLALILGFMLGTGAAFMVALLGVGW